jgi:hypothetical protein
MNQIFKTTVPLHILKTFLSSICLHSTSKYIVLNKTSFNKAIYLNLIEQFKQNIRPHYHKSKQYYIDRDLNYSRLMTIIRHLCIIHNIPYTSNIKYCKSTYDIIFNVYIDITH